MSLNDLDLDKARHDESIALAEMEAAKLMYDIAKKKYNKAKFVLTTLLERRDASSLITKTPEIGLPGILPTVPRKPQTLPLEGPA